MKHAGFSLVELLVVIAIIAVLAAILFPVFARAKAEGKRTQCLSNIKQITTSTHLYLVDNDDSYFSDRFNCGGDDNNKFAAVSVCDAYIENGALSPNAPDQSNKNLAGWSASSPANQRQFWVYTLYPYTKSFALFKDPDSVNTFYPGSGEVVKFTTGNGAQASQNYGGQNSYGTNFGWITTAVKSKGGASNLPVGIKAGTIPRASSTIFFMDSGYWKVGPDVVNASGLTICSHLTAGVCPSVGGSNAEYYQLIGGTDPANQSPYFVSFWANQGAGDYSVEGSNPRYVTPTTTPPASDFLSRVVRRHDCRFNAAFIDGHAKNMPYQQTIGDVCFWTTDVEGPHPNCQ